MKRLVHRNVGSICISRKSESFLYDPAGNRTGADNPTTGHTGYNYNEANQLTSSVNNGTTTSYSYNASGALSQKSAGTGTTTYAYSGMDRLTQINTPASTIDYAYDALGRRINRTEGTDVTNFHLSGKSDLADYWTNAGGGIAGQLTRGPDGLIAFTTDPTSSPFPCYQLFSPHGDTTMITDSGGSSFWQTRYDAFGNVVGGATPWYGYLGKYERYTDETAHLIQMGIRDYDPATGRFTAADPLKGPATDPQQRNRYQYVGNDPLTRYDLSGLFSLSDVKNGLEDFGNDTLGLAGDYLTGGGTALACDWWEGFSSMSTRGKIAIIALPAVPIAAAAGASIAGVGEAVLWGGETLMAEAPEVVDLLGEEGGECLGRTMEDLNSELSELQQTVDELQDLAESTHLSPTLGDIGVWWEENFTNPAMRYLFSRMLIYTPISGGLSYLGYELFGEGTPKAK